MQSLWPEHWLSITGWLTSLSLASVIHTVGIVRLFQVVSRDGNSPANVHPQQGRNLSAQLEADPEEQGAGCLHSAHL